MTTAEPPSEPTPAPRGAERSAPRSTASTSGAADTPEEGTPGNGETPYNLSARIFRDAPAPEPLPGETAPSNRNGSSDGNGRRDDRSSGSNGSYNLASQIYERDDGDTTPARTHQPPTRRQRPAPPADAPYNLATRVYEPLVQVTDTDDALGEADDAVLATPEAAPAIAPPARGGGRRWRLPRTFEALEFGPFRWYMGAMIWWNAAMGMQMLVRGYLAFQLTGDFRALGIVGLGSGVPMLLLSPLGGVIADRTSRRLVLQVGQLFSVLIAVVMGALLFADMLQFWHLIAASVAQGVMMALVMPSRQAWLPDVVGMKRLMNAIPLQTAGMNLMQLIAPAIGGIMIDWIGAGSVYSVMAVMYLMSVIALFGVKSMSTEDLEASRIGMGIGPMAHRGKRGTARGPTRRGSALSELKAGINYIFRDRTILSIMSLAFISSMLAMPLRMLLPGYVAVVFDDSGFTLGLLTGAMAIGALAGALGLATLRMRHHRGLLFGSSAILMGIAMMAFSTTTIFILGAAGLFVIGVGSAGRQSMSQILVQEYVEDIYRGRVMSVFMMQFSLMSVGTLFVGIYMEAVGAQFAIGSLGGVLVVATVLYFAVVPRLRLLA